MLTEGTIITIAITAAVTMAVQLAVRRLIAGGPEKREISNATLNVEQRPRYMTVEQCLQSHQQFERRMAQAEKALVHHEERFHALEQRLMDAGEQRAAKIHDRINDVIRAIGRLEGKGL